MGVVLSMLTTLRVRAADCLRSHWIGLALMVVVMLMAALHPAGAIAGAGHALPLWLGPWAGMVIIPWKPTLTYDELTDASSPSDANQPEVIPWQLYDGFAPAI